jgi:hypothetical protein
MSHDMHLKMQEMTALRNLPTSVVEMKMILKKNDPEP